MKLPKAVRGLAGPITVRLVKDLKDGDTELLGQWRSSEREILLRSNPEVSAHTRLITFHHECFEAFLSDAHIKVKHKEQMCDLYAAWKAGE